MTNPDNLPVPARHRELTPKEVQAHSDRAFRAERRIKALFLKAHDSWWALSKALYEFHEGGYWAVLGYDSLEDFLVQPDLGIARTQFFRMTKLWRDLVVVRQIAPADLVELEPTKVGEVAPAIMRGDVKIADALDDAKQLGWRDVRAKYRIDPTTGKTESGHKPDGSTPLNAGDEPARVLCAACGYWNVPKPSPSAGTPSKEDA